jgi:hypothetical protein
MYYTDYKLTCYQCLEHLPHHGQSIAQSWFPSLRTQTHKFALRSGYLVSADEVS